LLAEAHSSALYYAKISKTIFGPDDCVWAIATPTTIIENRIDHAGRKLKLRPVCDDALPCPGIAPGLDHNNFGNQEGAKWQR